MTPQRWPIGTEVWSGDKFSGHLSREYDEAVGGYLYIKPPHSRLEIPVSSYFLSLHAFPSLKLKLSKKNLLQLKLGLICIK